MPLSGPFLQELERIVGAGGLVRTLEGRLVYECDMHTFYKGAPDAVALPSAPKQVREIVQPLPARAGAHRAARLRHRV